jgi:RNA recognition motif-containing protein
MKLIVLNLPRSLGETDLEKLFKAHGDVTACNLVMDDESGASKGFGFVEMANEEEASKAIDELHGSKHDGRKIRVKPSH